MELLLDAVVPSCVCDWVVSTADCRGMTAKSSCFRSLEYMYNYLSREGGAAA